jgi:hypothetical protein
MDDARDGKARESWSYSGEVWTDAQGRTVVVLPSFAEATARFGYELTPVDQRQMAALGADRRSHLHDRDRRAAREGHVAREAVARDADMKGAAR